MEYIATFDIGTTAVKGVLVALDGRAAAARSLEIPTLADGRFREQRPQDWWDAFRAISLDFCREAPPEKILGVAMSGQMQDLIPLDGDLDPVCPAILYADGRAEDQAEALEAAVGPERFLALTGSRCDGSLPLPKLMWLRERRPELYARTRHILISSKDYVAARLTACSTAGAMDIREKRWSPALLGAAGVPEELFPRLLFPHERAGAVLPGTDCGYLPGTPIYVGVGDAGATTLACGAVRPGQIANRPLSACGLEGLQIAKSWETVSGGQQNMGYSIASHVAASFFSIRPRRATSVVTDRPWASNAAAYNTTPSRAQIRADQPSPQPASRMILKNNAHQVPIKPAANRGRTNQQKGFGRRAAARRTDTRFSTIPASADNTNPAAYPARPQRATVK